ncbi:MAG: hypothetical protein V4582_15580 [Pseudomonadota bacterium]
MKLSRLHRCLVAIVTLFSMLYMQLAVAAYRCPMQTMDAPQMMAMSMAGCTGMDMEQPTLCAMHGGADSAALERPDAPQISPFVPSSLVLTVAPPPPVPLALALPPQTELLMRSTAPPLSIRHCCLRF